MSRWMGWLVFAVVLLLGAFGQTAGAAELEVARPMSERTARLVAELRF